MILKNVGWILSLMLCLGLAGCGGGEKEEFKGSGLDIQVKNFPAHKIVYKEITGSYDQFGEYINELVNWRMNQSPRPDSILMVGIFPDNPELVPVDSLKSVVGIVVPEDFEGDENHPVKEIPAMTAASVLLKGPYDRIVSKFEGIYGWIAQNDYAVAGPLYEYYLKGGPGVPETEYMTEIRIPVQHLEPGSK
jgi:AraC family transcriptional regulator